MPYAIEGKISKVEMPGGIPITDQQYREALAGMMSGKLVTIEGGFALIDKPDPTKPPDPEPLTLDEVKAQMRAKVDWDAEMARRQFITPGAGQAMTYQQKAEEARACLADPDPQPENYPMLAAEISITADDLSGVATIVNGAYEMWRVIGAQIEALRLSAKAAVDAAATIEAATNAANVDWSSIS